MKNVIKNTKFLLIATAVIILVIVSTILLTGKTKKSEEIERPLLSKDMIFNLLIYQDDLPWDVILADIDIGSKKLSCSLFPYKGTAKYEMGWAGKLFDKGPGISKSPECNIRIAVAIAETAEEAVKIAYEQANSYSVPTNDLMNDEQVSAIADCAWGDIDYDRIPGEVSSMIYTYDNVVLHIVMGDQRSSDPQLIIDLAALLSRKIDAALAGKPEPIPILPLTYQELQVDIDGAFGMRGIGTYLWGKDSKNIALYDVNGVPRSLPAKQLSSGDYLVPLRHAGAILGPDGILEKRNELPEMKITMMGKTLVFYQNKSEILVNDKEVKLSRPIEFRGGEVLVPLTSLVQKALGKKITWSKRGSTMIGKVE